MKFVSLSNLTLLLVAALIATGCGGPRGTVLGKNPEGAIYDSLAIRAGDTPSELLIQGKLVEKCPQAGCWFRVQDGSGIIKVDTKTAGFVVTDVPLETVVTVAGKLVMEGEEQVLQATGLRY